MKVIRKDEPAKVDRSDAPIFFGGRVTGWSVVGQESSNNFIMGIVEFERGARNHFHTHTTDQILYATSGTGIVATEAGEVVIGEGDTALIPAGQKHWHGATPDSDFAHISLQATGSQTEIFPA